MSKGADIERRFGRNLYESLGARNREEAANSESKAGQGGGRADADGPGPADGRTRLREAGVMEIDRITPDPDQPRRFFEPDAIHRLASSLKSHGQLQPIRVRWSDSASKWIIIAGERRYRAAVEAGLKTIQCIFVDPESPDEPSIRLAEQMVENCLREDLSPVEQAKAFDRLMKMQGWNAKQLAEELHVSPASVSRALALLGLPPELHKEVDSGAIPASAGYELAKVQDPDQQQSLAQKVISGELNRDQIANAVRETLGKPPKVAKPKAANKTAASPSSSSVPDMIPPSTPAINERKYQLVSGAVVIVQIPKSNASDSDYLQVLSSLVDALKKTIA